MLQAQSKYSGWARFLRRKWQGLCFRMCAFWLLFVGMTVLVMFIILKGFIDWNSMRCV